MCWSRASSGAASARPCLAGQPNVCLADKATAFGTVPDLPGGQAEAMAVPFADLFTLPIPEGVADEEAVLLTDILPTGYLGALRANIQPGATVVVVGLGPVGIMALQCASLFGPARILAVDMVPETAGPGRAPRGRAHRCARSHPDRLQVLEATGGRGAESVIEAVGADATVLDAVACAATGGTVSVVGVNLTMDLPFPMGIVFLKSLTLRAVFAPDSRHVALPRPAPAIRPAGRPGRDVHPPHGPEPGPRGLRVVRLPGRRRLEGLADAESLSPSGSSGVRLSTRGNLASAELGSRDEPRAPAAAR